MPKKTAIIIGAGPAGLTAAYELLKRTQIKPIVLEKSDYIGGIARTVNYKGNRMDLGGHRFFSKSDRVMQWWLNIFPLEKKPLEIKQNDEIMLERSRLSRIYFRRRFFSYPVKLNGATLKKLGILRSSRIGLSYFKSLLFPMKPEKNLEDFFINRFGRELYQTFFKSYTEKVWGIPCHKISADWGAQRVKGLSILKTIKHHFKKIFAKKTDIKQKEIETSLIEKFIYPKFGPGQLWEAVARFVQKNGGQVIKHCEVQSIFVQKNRISKVKAKCKGNKIKTFQGDYFFSTMAIRDLIRALKVRVPKEIKKISEGLIYRDFITIGVLLKQLKIKSENGDLIRDNWIYIQEPDVEMGRLQIFNNWSPYLVANPKTVWLGLEYFCFEGDHLWQKKDREMIKFAIGELAHIDIIDQKDVLDATVLRMPKTYPAYFGTYKKFPKIKKFVNKFENLYLIGRNGMHRYNNMDHSMLTAMIAVDNIVAGKKEKENIWAVNIEKEYHEKK